MKNKNLFLVYPAFLAALAFLFSCASAPGPTGTTASPAEEQKSFLPLMEGWYLYDFERTFKGIEDEYNFAQSMGMKMIEEITLRQTGTVTWCEDGILHDPVLETELTVDEEGNIRGVENPSVSGTLSEDGAFYWSGLVDQLGRLNHVSVRGKLSYLPRSVRGGGEYDGVYHLTDTGTGREQLARVQDGFYTWRYTDGEEAGFTPWPTLIRPDGSFGFEMEMTTVQAMGDFARADYSTNVVVQGRISPGGGISVEEMSHTTGRGVNPSGGDPQIYAGTMIREGEYPNGEIPQDPGALLRLQVEAAKRAAPIDWSRYPPWYRKPPLKTGFIYAAGEKTFQDRDTAFAMAEAAAAANIAVRLRAQVASGIDESTDETGTRLDSRTQIDALENIPYRVTERIYREDSGTAFVLLELDLAALRAQE